MLKPPSDLETRIVRGRNVILPLKSLMIEIGSRYDQLNMGEHLEYFFDRVEVEGLEPHLVLIGPGLSRPSTDARAAIAAMLVYEFRWLGLPTGFFTVDDFAGRRCLMGPAHLRTYLARMAAGALMEKGARAIAVTWPHLPSDQTQEIPLPGGRQKAWMFATSRRLFYSHLPLESTLDATLAKMHQKTRFNLRYYRRRAEKDLGARFFSQACISREEFQEFDRRCAYAVGKEESGRRYDAVTQLPGMWLCGVQRDNGEWLSLLGARRYGRTTEILWQLNRTDVPNASLSTVIRSYFLEHEIARGTRLLYIEGGTSHAMQFSFVKGQARSMIVLRYGWMLPFLRRYPNLLRSRLSLIRKLLSNKELKWMAWA